MFQEIYEIDDVSKSKQQKKNQNSNIKGKISNFIVNFEWFFGQEK